MAPLTAWLLTYLLHSTLLLGAAALLSFALRDRRLALQEAALRAALLGGLATASLQLGLGLLPWGGVLANPLASPIAEPRVLTGAAGGERAATAPAAPLQAVAAAPAAAGPAPALFALPLERTPRAAGASLDARVWAELLLALWALSAGWALARLAVAAGRLRHLLRGRRPLAPDPELAAVAGQLGLRPPLRISVAPRLQTPLATGLLRPEVCLPARVLEEMAGEDRTALCAHELAHVSRLDPAWILLARGLEAAIPLQPLNRWARRRLQDLAECLSDDLAAAATGGRLGLARSLVDVAGWSLAEPAAIPAAPAVRLRSRLGHRVERLMDPLRALETPGRLLLPLALAAAVATAVIVPVVSGTPVSVAGGDDPALATPATPSPAPAPRAPRAPAPPRAARAPEPSAQPEPAALPAPAPAPVPETPPPPRDRSDAERELERVQQRIAERQGRHSAELDRLEAEIEGLASRMRPHEGDLERLGRDLERAGRELADAEGAAEGRGSERAAAARRRMEELQRELRESAESMRPSAEQIRGLHERARELAEQARPTDEELRELRRLANEVARDSARQSAEDQRLAAREAAQAAREAAAQAREEVRRATEELRRAEEELRRAEERARRHGDEEREAPKPERE